MYLNSSKPFFLAGFVMLISACASQPKVEMAQALSQPATAVVQPMAPNPAELASYEAAVQALDAGDVVAAKPVFESLSKKYPDFAGPLVNLAIVAEQEGDIDGAIAQYQVALAIQPDHVAALNNLAILLQTKGEFSRAAEFYKRGLSKSPDSPELNYNLAVLYELYLRDFEKAVKYYEVYSASLSQPDADMEVLLKGLKRRIN
ncbi:MAG: tetratricopeptide repeat protein [Hahellaceae bacterium]|nr:tetratricopeptide repeat protein [Hahellaceae bacterium]